VAAVKIAAHHLNRRGGVLIGDVVGLGKTLMATTLARIMQDDMDKTSLLKTIQTEYAEFESIVAPLSEAQLCSPTLDGGWSVKDIMAHVAVWEQICTRIMGSKSSAGLQIQRWIKCAVQRESDLTSSILPLATVREDFLGQQKLWFRNFKSGRNVSLDRYML
jgi:hypothetical protein